MYKNRKYIDGELCASGLGISYKVENNDFFHMHGEFVYDEDNDEMLYYDHHTGTTAFYVYIDGEKGAVFSTDVIHTHEVVASTKIETGLIKLSNSQVKDFIKLTQAQYDTLVANDQIDEDTFYFIEEE